MKEHLLKALKRFIDGGGDLNVHPDVAVRLAIEAIREMRLEELFDIFAPNETP